MVPHITDAIQEWVERVANQSVTEDGTKPEVLIYEFLLLYKYILLLCKLDNSPKCTNINLNNRYSLDNIFYV